MAEETIKIELRAGDDATWLALHGDLTIHQVTRLHASFSQLAVDAPLVIDFGAIGRLDTAGAWALSDLKRRVTEAGGTVRIENAGPDMMLLLDSVAEAMPKPEALQAGPRGFVLMLETAGRSVIRGLGFALELMGYLGLFFARLGHVLRHPREFRLTALVAHAEDVGLRAVPIVALMAFLIGVVLAFQGSAQLRQFGAEVFVVDLIAISVLRELGILLTAIIVAGRTASAFTAAIGSMKMREEIDAMRTLGLDPATVLFVPRILALLFMLPILGLIANLMGLFGGALMAWIELGISPSMFRTRLLDGTDISHVFVGLVKAPVFALIIGVVGCHAGMQVKGNAESLGRMTSNAVVTAIFTVIVADALFSIFFAQVGL